MRIASNWLKVACVVGSLVVTYCLALVGTHLPAAFGYVFPILFLVLTLSATRVFRGKGEAILPARPWWRFTGGALAGFLLTTLLVLGLISDVLVIVKEHGSVPLHFATLTVDVILIAGYLNSSIRLVSTAKRERVGV
jgi:hypothetical protein